MTTQLCTVETLHKRVELIIVYRRNFAFTISNGGKTALDCRDYTVIRANAVLRAIQ